MPRGVPQKGFRLRKSKKTGEIVKVFVKGAANDHSFPTVIEYDTDVPEETDQEIDLKLRSRFEILEHLVNQATSNEIRALIVSGPPGLGKSYTVETALDNWDPSQQKHTIIRGYVKATGLYKMLYQYRQAGNVLVFDDADSIFNDETALTLLKAVCDTTDKRRVSYLSEGSLVSEENAERIPNQFDFDATIIFITNYDFDTMIDRGHKLAPHLKALVSRAHYVDLAMKTRRDYLIRIAQAIRDGLLTHQGLSEQMQTDVVQFIEDNNTILRELSLRIALKIASIRKSNNNRWQNIATVTCCRNQ